MILNMGTTFLTPAILNKLDATPTSNFQPIRLLDQSDLLDTNLHI